jgi:hypothetical protein
MAAALILEQDSGTWTGSTHPHNGYYAGDFSDVPPLTPSQLDTLMAVCRDGSEGSALISEGF